MSDKFEVDLPGLIQGGADVGHRAEIVSAAHRRSISALSDAEAGWIGSSADALVAMAAKLDKISARHTKAIENHSLGMDTAAKLFADKEEQRAARLRAIGERSGSVDL